MRGYDIQSDVHPASDGVAMILSVKEDSGDLNIPWHHAPSLLSYLLAIQALFLASNSRPVPGSETGRQRSATISRTRSPYFGTRFSSHLVSELLASLCRRCKFYGTAGASKPCAHLKSSTTLSCLLPSVQLSSRCDSQGKGKHVCTVHASYLLFFL